MFNYNTIYNDPVISNVANVLNPHVLSLPQDAVDPVAVSTANPSWETVGNTCHFLMRTFSSYRPHVAISSFNLTSINIEEFGISYAFNAGDSKYIPNYTTGTTTLTPMGLMATTWYYIYMVLNTGVLTNPSFEVSTTVPDPNMMWQNGDPGKRYIGCFLTDAMSQIVPFTMTDFDYTFAVPQDTNYSAFDFAGPGPVDLFPITITGTAKTLKTLIRAALPGNATGTLFFTIAPKEVATVTTANWPGFAVNPIECGGDYNSVVTVQTFVAEYPLYASRRLSMAVQPVIVTAKNRVWWTGFKE
ncbi:MAG: hypothetical protein EKK57_11055 [Proteobacteria bacterium]|nr:MAG: hypothetical protein EKK57_11055 [Pseudomonadota bacterium]